MPISNPEHPTILEEGVVVKSRPRINFIGTNVTATDDPTNGKVDVTVTGGAGGGDVTGPAASVDNALARFDGITGKLLQDYTSNPPTVSDTGDVNIDGDLDVENIVVSGTVDGVDVSALVTNATHTGEVTGSVALTIANDAVTYAKMQNVSATDKVLGRATAGAGDVEEIACTAAGRALLDDANAAAQLVTLGDAAAAVVAVNAAGVLLADAKAVEYTTPSVSHTASGIFKTKTAGIALVFGNACYTGIDGKMEKALADDAAVTIPATHVCVAENIAEDAAGLFLEQGEFHDDTLDGLSIGLSVYLSAATAGLITKTMPTKVTGNQVQVLGTAIATGTIYWNPSMIVMEYA